MGTSDSSVGCFQWIVSLGQSVDKRWSQFRNAFIKRFRKENPKAKTRELVNESGTPDLVFTKRPLTPKRPLRSAISDVDLYSLQCLNASSPCHSSNMIFMYKQFFNTEGAAEISLLEKWIASRHSQTSPTPSIDSLEVKELESEHQTVVIQDQAPRFVGLGLDPNCLQRSSTV